MNRFCWLLIGVTAMGCGGTAPAPVTHDQLHSELKGTILKIREDTKGIVRTEVDNRVKGVEAKIATMHSDIKTHVSKDGASTREELGAAAKGILANDGDIMKRLQAQQELIAGLPARFAPPPPSMASGFASPGGDGGVWNMTIDTTVNGVKMSGNGPTSLQEMRNLLAEQQQKRREREVDAFWRTQAYRTIDRIDSVETRVTDLEAEYRSAVAKLHNDIRSLDVRVTDKEAALKERLEELATRLRVPIYYCAPPEMVPYQVCYTRRVGLCRRCLYVW